MKVSEAVERASNIDNAIAYSLESDQYVFCVDLLGISAHHTSADYWVNRLEDAFLDLLGEK